MAYYIMYNKRRNDYQELEITKSKYYKRLSRFVNNGSTIKEIDLFTTNFKDEEDLRIKLLKEGVLNGDNYDSNLSIRSYKKGNYQKVMYDFLYQDSLEYLNDPKKIIYEINFRLMCGDYEFIKKYVEHFVNYYECGATASEIRMYLDDTIRSGITNRHLYESDENGNTPLVRMSKLLIYKHYTTRDGKIVYKDEVNDYNLHTIIALYKYHYNKKEVQKEQDVKVRKLKKNEFPGQFSLFDKKD